MLYSYIHSTTAKYTLHRLHVAVLLQQIAILDYIILLQYSQLHN